MSDPIPEFTPEAPTNGDAYARKLGLWVKTYGSSEMDRFIADVKTLAAAADTSAKSAAQYSNQASKDAAIALSARDQATAQVGKAAEQVALATAQANTATQQGQLASMSAANAKAEADRAKTEADRAKQIVDAFDPSIYRYGYTAQKKQAEQDFIEVLGTEFGYTYHLRKRSVCLLPGGDRDPTLRVGQLVHFQSTEWAGEGFFVGHAGVTVLCNRDSQPILRPRGRATATYIAENTWSVEGDLESIEGSFWVAQQGGAQYLQRIDVDITGHYRRAMRFERNRFWLSQLRWHPDLPKTAVHITALNPRFQGLPDGYVQLMHSNNDLLQDELCFGWPNHDRLNEFPYYWTQGGINGIVSPIQIDGHLPVDWRIVSVDADFTRPVKHALFRLYNRQNSTYKSMVCTSTQGLLWDPKPYKKLNDQIGIREAFAHFPSVLNNTGKLYLREGTKLRLITYDLLNDTYPSVEFAQCNPKTLQFQRRVGDEFYCLAYGDGFETAVIGGDVNASQTIAELDTPYVVPPHGQGAVDPAAGNDRQMQMVFVNAQGSLEFLRISSTNAAQYVLDLLPGLVTGVHYCTTTKQDSVVGFAYLTGVKTAPDTTERFALAHVTTGLLPNVKAVERARGGAVPDAVLGLVRRANPRENWRGELKGDPWLALETSVGVYYDYPKLVPEQGGGGGTVRPTNTAMELVAAGGKVTVDPALADTFRVQLQDAKTTLTLAAPNGKPGTTRTCNIILHQGTGVNQVLWPANIRWSYKQAPVLSLEVDEDDYVVLVNFGTDDYWYGFLTGGWFHG